MKLNVNQLEITHEDCIAILDDCIHGESIEDSMYKHMMESIDNGVFTMEQVKDIALIKLPEEYGQRVALAGLIMKYLNDTGSNIRVIY